MVHERRDLFVLLLLGILLPGVILAIFGFSGLRHDRRLSERQALDNLQNAVDAGPHGDFIDYYLDTMKAQETAQGRRILDVLDLHWYTEVYAGGAYVGDPYDTSASVVASRVQVPRSLWDPNYVDPTWINDKVQQKKMAIA